jgi:hypothetical protein
MSTLSGTARTLTGSQNPCPLIISLPEFTAHMLYAPVVSIRLNFWRLRPAQNGADDLAVDIGEAEVAAAITESKLLVIEAE